MKIDKLRSVREGQRRCVEIQVERIERGKENSSMIEFNAILEAIVRKAETIKSLNEKILELTEVIDIEEEIVSSEEYGLTLEIKVRELRAYSENRKSNTEEQQNAYSEPSNPQNKNQDGSGSLIENNNVNNGNNSLQNVSTFHSNTSLYQRLPKLSLPVFSGDILEWQSFWDAFDSSVHQNPNLTEVQKFNYLKTQLEGSAAQVIQGFALTHANYIQAVDLLKERFGQSHKIIHAYIQALLNLPAPSNTLHSMRNYYDKLEAYIRGLESLGQCQNTYGTLLVPVIIDKLPAEIRKSLARENGSDKWSLESLRKALYRELNIMEAGQTTDDLAGYRTTASFFTGARRKPEAGSHVIHRRMHKTLIDQRKYSRPKINTCPTNLPSTGSDTSTQIQATVLHSRSETRPDVLLKTAVAQVCSETQFAQANILFDEGAQRSFISEKLAKRLKVQPRGSSAISLAAFGDSSQKLRHLDTTTIYLLTDAGDNLPLEVMIVPTIAVPLRHIPQSVTSLPHLRKLKLAHPVINEDSFEISLLIGADQYWNIVGNETIRGDGPTALSSSIGYLLSGPVQAHGPRNQSYLVMNVMSTDIDRFWKLESLGINPEEDDYTDTLEIYKQNCVKFTDGKYEAKLPWKEDHATLPTNYDVTKRRTESLINLLRRDPSILPKYAEIIQEQEQ
ncbi:uncharacterized protein LOC132748688 [Ruditapes philippinarum]|uniref:uncharacterized protein LOC132748688 n=1 Tax=Ruditapes philippinarum TaxID=129788 RepID=UPI00295BF0C0|nr:uncharacterized protein LOC132748688 [Ruditapes philippinarum]